MRMEEKDGFDKLTSIDIAWMDQKGNIMMIEDMKLKHIMYTVKMLNKHNFSRERKGKKPFVIPNLMLKLLNENPEYLV